MLTRYDDVLFAFKRRDLILPFSSSTFAKLLKRAAQQVYFSPVKPYCFRRGAHTNLYMADEDGIVNCSPRTLKTIGNHALDYHEKYVHVDLNNLALKFALVKKIRIEEFVDSLSPQNHTRLASDIASVNVRRAATIIMSQMPVCFSPPLPIFSLHTGHVITEPAGV